MCAIWMARHNQGDSQNASESDTTHWGTRGAPLTWLRAGGYVYFLIKYYADAQGRLDVCKSEKFNYMCH